MGQLIFVTNSGGGGGGGGSPLTTKGDLFTFTTLDARLPVGADGQVLTAASAETEGVKWETPTGLPAFSNIQYSVLMEDPAGVAVFQQLTLDMILPAFAITSYAKTAPGGATSLYRRGDEVSGLTASASYTSVPSSASIANSLGGSAGGGDIAPPATWGTFVSPFTAATMGGSVRRDGSDGGANPTMTATLTAVGATSPTAAFTVTWALDTYYGVSNVANINDETNFKAIPGVVNTLTAARQQTFALNPVGEKFYYALPQSYGTPTFTDGNGFGIGMQAPTVDPGWTNNGVSNTYVIWESVQFLTGALTVTIG